MTLPNTPVESSIETSIELIRESGLLAEGRLPDARLVDRTRKLLSDLQERPHGLVVECLRTARDLRHAQERCGDAQTAAQELAGLLEQLLGAQPQVGRLERLLPHAPDAPDTAARALCMVGGQLRVLSVHPEVDRARLAALRPWHYLEVHPTEGVIVGLCDDPELHELSLGEVVRFQRWQQESSGLAAVQRQGEVEHIVLVAPELRARDLQAGDRLVLMHQDQRWAIAHVPNERDECRFRVPIEGIEERFEDLAGLDEPVSRLVEDVVLRLVHPEIREEFALRPLHGVLLWSHKPGMGKTALARAFARWLSELGQERGFDVELHVVQPGELKIVWHGGDAKMVREDLCGALRAKRMSARARPLIQCVVMDECDTLGKRSGGDDGQASLSAAQNDAVTALLAEMDGVVQERLPEGVPPAHILWIGLTNRPDAVDEALKRPRRFGDLMLGLDEIDFAGAAAILTVHARGARLPWWLDGAVRTGVEPRELEQRLLRPALERVFERTCLYYDLERQPDCKAAAGELLAGVHYAEAINFAKRRAARRRLVGEGPAAIGFEDVLAGLIEQIDSVARGMSADRLMLRRQLRLSARVLNARAVPREELEDALLEASPAG